MKIWVDDIRPAPEGYVRCKSVENAKLIIEYLETMVHYHNLILKGNPPPFVRANTEKELEIYIIEVIDIDHDAGDYAQYGGDYIKLLDWLEETGRNYPIRIHSMNVVGVANMRAIIQKNGWKEVIDVE